MKHSLSQELDRILSLYGIDEGFYVLAIHSFIESYTHSFDEEIQYSPTFSDKLKLLSILLGHDTSIGKPEVIWRLCQEHRCTNEVRHCFSRLSGDEAVGATKNFLDFCSFAGISDRTLEKFERNLSVWRDRSFTVEQQRELIQLRVAVRRLQEENSRLQEQPLTTDAETLEALQQKANTALADNRKLKKQLEAVKDKDALQRRKLFEAREQERKLKNQLQGLQGQKQYIAYLQRYSTYSRTRADYERSTMILSEQQRMVCSRIREHGDYLIRGGAGTGKTLVLIHAFIDQITQQRTGLGLLEEEPERFVLLTYTHTLVKFDRYLSSILKPGGQLTIQNIDAFLLERLHLIDPAYRMNYRRVSEAAEAAAFDFIGTKELEAEIETAIFGRALTRETYLHDPKARRGMKGKFTEQQKQLIWELSEQVRTQMVSEKGFSKEFGRLFLYEQLVEQPELRQRMMVRRIFIDELQDLAPVDLMLLKTLSQAGLVMAGDDRQSIYYSGMSFRQQGLDIVGRSHALTGNHRNTRQIHMLSELYRQKTSVQTSSFEESHSFREGPAVELWQRKNSEQLLGILSERIRFFLDVLGYAPENIGILAPDRKALTEIGKGLTRMELPFCDIHEYAFQFEETEGIRISTCHSAKGVEFAVVMLILPSITVSSRLAPDAALQASQNLIYMSMTRALDNLQIFTLQHSDNPLIDELTSVFHEYVAQSSSEDLASCTREGDTVQAER